MTSKILPKKQRSKQIKCLFILHTKVSIGRMWFWQLNQQQETVCYYKSKVFRVSFFILVTMTTIKCTF